MGHIQLKAGPLTATKPVADADLNKILSLVFEAHAPRWDRTTDPPTEIVYTNQQKLEFVGEVIINMLINDARFQHAKNKRAEAEAAISSEAKEIKL